MSEPPALDLPDSYGRQSGQVRVGTVVWPRDDTPGNGPGEFMIEQPATEAFRGERGYLDVLERIHRELAPDFYLEIGVRRGRSLSLATCRAVGVDPDFDVQFGLGAKTFLFRETSDAFFADHAQEVVPDSPSLVFIDGMHLFEFALRDFINAEQLVNPSSLVVIDDVFPNHALQAARERQTRVWTGDVWKVSVILQKQRPDLTLISLDTEPSGLLLIAGLDKDHRTLEREYDSIIREFSRGEHRLPPETVLDRQGALHPDDATVWDLIDRLRRLGRGSSSACQVKTALADSG